MMPFLKDLVGVHRAGNRLPKINLFFPIRPVIASGLVWHIVLEKASLRCKVLPSDSGMYSRTLILACIKMILLSRN